MAAYKRLDLERRCQIQILLDQNKSFREIAETIGVIRLPFPVKSDCIVLNTMLKDAVV